MAILRGRDVYPRANCRSSTTAGVRRRTRSTTWGTKLCLVARPTNVLGPAVFQVDPVPASQNVIDEVRPALLPIGQQVEPQLLLLVDRDGGGVILGLLEHLPFKPEAHRSPFSSPDQPAWPGKASNRGGGNGRELHLIPLQGVHAMMWSPKYLPICLYKWELWGFMPGRHKHVIPNLNSVGVGRNFPCRPRGL